MDARVDNDFEVDIGGYGDFHVDVDLSENFNLDINFES